MPYKDINNARKAWKRSRIKNKEHRRITSIIRTNKLIKEVFTAYGNKCACCGEAESLFFEIDHIKGNGSHHRKTVHGGDPFYLFLKNNNFPKDEYQLLCSNCNQGKHRNHGICPHQLSKSEK